MSLHLLVKHLIKIDILQIDISVLFRFMIHMAGKNQTNKTHKSNTKNLSSYIVSAVTNSRWLINNIVAKITGYWCLKLRWLWCISTLVMQIMSEGKISALITWSQARPVLEMPVIFSIIVREELINSIKACYFLAWCRWEQFLEYCNTIWFLLKHFIFNQSW